MEKEILACKTNCKITLENCKFVKMVLMLSVLIYHCVIHWRNNGWMGYPVIKSEALRIFTNWLGSFHIYAFTLVSGYIFAYKIWKLGGYSSYKIFVKTKAKRLIVPYIFTVVVWVIPIELLLSSNSGTVSFFHSYVLGEGPSQLWFLLMLFNVFIIVHPIRNIFLKPFNGFILSMIFYGTGVVGSHFFQNFFQIWTSFEYILYFYIGIQIRIRQEERKSFLMDRVPWWLWIFVHTVVFIIYLQIETFDNGILEKLFRRGFLIIYYVIGAISAFVILQKIAELIPWKNINIFKTLSLLSMPMYLFHQQIIYFVIIWLDGKISPSLNAIINFIVSFSVSFIISSVFMKFKATRFLIGEK